MTSRRLLFAAIAIALAIAAIIQLRREPASEPAVEPVAAASAPTASAPRQESIVLHAASAPTSVLRPSAVASATTAVAKLPRVGSEGYGPHIESAQAGNDAARIWEAAVWLRQCASNEERRRSFEQARNQGTAPQFMTALMEEADAEARRCQTVTAHHRAMLQELHVRAMRLGVREAAAVYAGLARPDELEPALRLEVSDAMRRHAEAGDTNSLLHAVIAPVDWGIADADKLAYLHAYAELAGLPVEAAVRDHLRMGIVHLRTPPTAEQLAQGRAAGRQIVERARRDP
jgi:hypothetical protein